MKNLERAEERVSKLMEVENLLEMQNNVKMMMKGRYKGNQKALMFMQDSNILIKDETSEESENEKIIAKVKKGCSYKEVAHIVKPK